MNNELIFKGQVFNGSLDMSLTEFVCVPSKPHYAAVDLCLRENGTTGPNICVADIDNNCLSFDEKKKLGFEIEKRWNQHSKLIDLLERSITGLEWRRDNQPETWNGADDEHLLECKNALGLTDNS